MNTHLFIPLHVFQETLHAGFSHIRYVCREFVQLGAAISAIPRPYVSPKTKPRIEDPNVLE